MKINKWFIILTWKGDKTYTLDMRDVDASEKEIRLCILEQVYGINVEREK